MKQKFKPIKYHLAAQLHDQLCDQLWHQLNRQLHDELSLQLFNQLNNQLRYQLCDKLFYRQLASQLGGQAKEVIENETK